jgi:hypothetical protein
VHQRRYHKTNQPLRKPKNIVNPTTTRGPLGRSPVASGSSAATAARARGLTAPAAAPLVAVAETRPRAVGCADLGIEDCRRLDDQLRHSLDVEELHGILRLGATFRYTESDLKASCTPRRCNSWWHAAGSTRKVRCRP